MYGIKLSNLTEEVFKKIALLYEEIIGGKAVQCLSNNEVARIREELNRSSSVEYKWGSSIASNDQFFVMRERSSNFQDPIVYFLFDGNTISTEETGKLKTAFSEAVDALLKQKAVAVELKYARR